MKQLDKPAFGVGYLYQWHDDYARFDRDLHELGAVIDIYELLAIHFGPDCHGLDAFVAQHPGHITIHSGLLKLSDLQRPGDAAVNKLNGLCKRSHCTYVGEHLALINHAGTACGSFMLPPGTREQARLTVENILAAQGQLQTPFIIENPVQFYNDVGGVSLAEQVNIACRETGARMLLSLSNVVMSRNYIDIDRDDMVDSFDLSLVDQVHLFLNNAAEQAGPGFERTCSDERWMLDKLASLLVEAPSFKPKFIVFELVAGTPSIVEPQRLNETMQCFRALLASKHASAR